MLRCLAKVTDPQFVNLTERKQFSEKPDKRQKLSTEEPVILHNLSMIEPVIDGAFSGHSAQDLSALTGFYGRFFRVAEHTSPLGLGVAAAA